MGEWYFVLIVLLNPFLERDADELQSVTAKVTAIVAGNCMVITGVLFVIYNFIVLRGIKKSHEREMDSFTAREGLVEKMERKVHELGLEPGSVV